MVILCYIHLYKHIVYKGYKYICIFCRFLKSLKTPYTNDNCCIMMDGSMSQTYANRQGFVRRTSLFNLFLTDLPCKHRYIIWADDVPLLSETVDGFGFMLKILSKYVEENNMEMNTDKSRCMIFNKCLIDVSKLTKG